MNLLVSTNKKYLDKTETMIFSLSSHVSESISVWCLFGGLPQKQQEAFSRYLLTLENVAKVEFVDMSWLDLEKNILPFNTSYLSIECYYRLFSQFFLPGTLDRILWLDSDIIVKGCLSDFYWSDFKGAALIAFSNMDEESDNDRHLRRLGLSLAKPYFNSGVLLLNLEYLRNNTTKASVLNFCRDNASRLRFEDQDVLNLLYHNSALILNDQRFNCMVNAPQDYSSPDIVEKAVILHYAGRQKPWRIQWQNDYSHFWWDVRREEGLCLRDGFAIAFGWVWKKCNGALWKQLLLKPYLWIVDRKWCRVSRG